MIFPKSFLQQSLSDSLELMTICANFVIILKLDNTLFFSLLQHFSYYIYFFYFKEQICSFVVDIFNINRVRYTTIDELVEDVWFILRTRTEMVQTRFSTELIPSG